MAAVILLDAAIRGIMTAVDAFRESMVQLENTITTVRNNVDENLKQISKSFDKLVIFEFLAYISYYKTVLFYI